MGDLRELPLDRFCNLVYWYATKDAENEAAVAKFEAKLWMPPRGVVATRGPWSPEAENAALSSLKAQLS